jgi:hypothetical protein
VTLPTNPIGHPVRHQPIQAGIYIGHPGLHRHIRFLTMRTETALEMSILYGHVTQLIACEDLIQFIITVLKKQCSVPLNTVISDIFLTLINFFKKYKMLYELSQHNHESHLVCNSSSKIHTAVRHWKLCFTIKNTDAKLVNQRKYGSFIKVSHNEIS